MGQKINLLLEEEAVASWVGWGPPDKQTLGVHPASPMVCHLWAVSLRESWQTPSQDSYELMFCLFIPQLGTTVLVASPQSTAASLILPVLFRFNSSEGKWHLSPTGQH